jgi:hypothetical protein
MTAGRSSIDVSTAAADVPRHNGLAEVTIETVAN